MAASGFKMFTADNNECAMRAAIQLYRDQGLLPMAIIDQCNVSRSARCNHS